MEIEIHNILIDKAKTRRDGIYSYKGYLYAVKGNVFIAYADYFGNVNSVHGIFHHNMGIVNRFDRKSKLLEYLKNN